MHLFIDMSIYWYINKQEQVRGQILNRLTASKIIYIMLENMWILKVLAKKAAHRFKNVMLQKSVTHGFAGTVTRPVFLCLQIKQHDLDFPSRENGKKLYIFFIRSGLYSFYEVTFNVSVISRDTSWTKNAVNLYFCILCPS